MEKRFILMGATALLLAGFVGISLFNFFKTSDEVTGSLIVQDIAKLAEIFGVIHARCHIINFDHQKNPIDFLNVKEFSSSEVGSMNLGYPKKWQGPYLDENLTMQGKQYQVVRTHQGYFITPGEGVELPNGKVIGKDIILDENANISVMMQDRNALSYKGYPLAARMNLEEPVEVEVVELSE